MLNEKISYQIIRSQRKTMSLEIKSDGQIIVRAPLRLSQVRIRRFVEQKQEWILKNLEKIQKREVQRGRTNPSAAGSLPENSRAHSLFCRKNRGKLRKNYPAPAENKMGQLQCKWKSEL